MDLDKVIKEHQWMTIEDFGYLGEADFTEMFYGDSRSYWEALYWGMFPHDK